MGDLELGRPAVEPPARRIAPRSRRGRPLVGLSGLMLFVCLFLPAVQSCGSPVTPLEMPPFWPPYVYGLVFAIAALWHTPRGLVVGLVLLRLVTALVVIGGLVVATLEPSIGVVELILGGVLLHSVGLFETSEARVPAIGLATGVICTLWFAFWTTTGDALIGVHLALLGSLGLFAGSLQWLRAVLRPLRSPQIDMPRAAAIVRHRR